MNTIEQLKSSAKCTEVLQKLGIEFWSTGNSWKFRYPNCRDGSSTYISPEDTWWRIHSKGVGGDVISLYSYLKYGEKSRRGIIRELIQLLGLTQIPDPTPADESTLDTDRIFDIVQEFALAEQDKAIKIAGLRMISEDIVKQYHIGYITDGNKVVDAIQNTMGGLRRTQECGLLTDTGNFLLNDRMIFPVFHRGRIAGFIGYSSSKEPKYMMLRKTPRVQRVAYGLDTLSDGNMTSKVAWIVEGVFDQLSCVQAGFPAIALLSSHASPEMLDEVAAEIKAKASPAKLALDYDAKSKAGQIGTKTLLRNLLVRSITCSVVRLSPDVFLAEAPAGKVNLPNNMRVLDLCAMFGSAKNDVKHLCESLGVPIHKEAHIAGARDLFNKIIKRGFCVPNDPTLQPLGTLHEYAQQATQFYNTPEIPKIDINNIWVITGGSANALSDLSEQAINPVRAYLEGAADGKTSGMNTRDLTSLAKKEYNALAGFVDTSTVHEGLVQFGLTNDQAASVVHPKNNNPVVVYSNKATSMREFKYAPSLGLMMYDESKGYWRGMDERELCVFFVNYILPDNETIADYSIKLPLDLTTRTAISRDEEDQMLEDARNFIVLRNGTYDIRNNKFINEFSHTRLVISCINADYEENADCPKFKQFMHDILIRPDEETDGENPDLDKRIEYVREMLGLLLVPDNSYQKIWFWLGGGGNGKSELQFILKTMIGSDRISELSLEQFKDPTMNIALLHKLINISGDETAAAFDRNSWGIVKKISGGDSFMTRGLYQDAKSIRPYSRLVFSCNDMPRIHDDSHAMKRRLEVVNFPVQFVDEIDPDKADYQRKRIRDFAKLHLLDEASGIFKWLIDGYCNLRNRGRFIELKWSSEALVADAEHSPAVEFLQSRLTESADPNDYIKMRDLYNEWDKSPYALREKLTYQYFSKKITMYVEERHKLKESIMTVKQLKKGSVGALGQPYVIKFARWTNEPRGSVYGR